MIGTWLPKLKMLPPEPAFRIVVSYLQVAFGHEDIAAGNQSHLGSQPCCIDDAVLNHNTVASLRAGS